MDISLREGRVTLKALELDGQVITDKLNDAICSGGSTKSDITYQICIKTILVEELNISLFMIQDENDDNDSNENGDGNMEMKNTSNGYSFTGARLVAEIKLNGVQIKVEIEPSKNSEMDSITSSSENNEKDEEVAEPTPSTTTAATTITTATSSAKGYIQSYIQAALDSLKLSLSIHNLSIELSSLSSEISSSSSLQDSSSSSRLDSTTPCIILHLNSLSYKDSSLPPPPVSISATTSQENDEKGENVLPQNYNHQQQKDSSPSILESKVILGKEICFDQLLIGLSGGSSDYYPLSTTATPIHTPIDKSFEIIRFDGLATVIVTIMSNKSVTTRAAVSSSIENTRRRRRRKKDVSTTTESLERHLEVALDDKLDIDLSPVKLKIIHQILGNKNDDVDTSSATRTIAKKSSQSSSTGNGRKISNHPSISKIENQYEVDFHDDDEDEHDLGLLSNIVKQQLIGSSRYNTSSASPLIFNDYYGRKEGTCRNNADISSSTTSFAVENEKPGPMATTSINELFDTNQEGYSHYCNLLESSLHGDSDEQHQRRHDDKHQSGNGVDNVIITTVCLYLKEVNVNVHIEPLNDHKLNLSQSSSSLFHDDECIRLTINDVNAVMSQMSRTNGCDFSLDMKDFNIKHVVLDYSQRNESNQRHWTEKDSILKFINVSTHKF